RAPGGPGRRGPRRRRRPPPKGTTCGRRFWEATGEHAPTRGRTAASGRPPCRGRGPGHAAGRRAMSGAEPSAAASVASALVPLPVILPLAAAGLKLTIGLRLQRTQRVISAIVLAIVLVVSLVLLVVADQDGPQVMYAGGWAPPVGIVLVADRLSALMLVVSSAVTLCVLLYSIGQGMADREEAT